MAETSFSCSSSRCSVVVTNNLTIVHTFDLTPPDVEVSEPDGLPAAIRSSSTAPWTGLRRTDDDDLPRLVDRPCSCRGRHPAPGADRHGRSPAGLRVVDDYNDRCIIPDERQYPNHPVVL